MTEPAAPSVPDQFEEHVPTLVQLPFILRLGRFSLVLLLCSGLLALGAGVLKAQTEAQQHRQLAALALVESRIAQELAAWNTTGASAVEPLALRGLLALGQQVSQNSQGFSWYGNLYSQTLQSLLTQAIETLSRPVAGVSTEDPMSQARMETQVRLDTLPKIAQLKAHIQSAQNGILTVMWAVTFLLSLASVAMGLKWWSLKSTHTLKQRIHVLSRAVNTQQQADQRLDGVNMALEGVMAALSKSQKLEHHSTLLQIGRQLEELNQSGRAVLDFAKSFHHLSAQGTQVAKTALHSEQRNAQAESHIEIMQAQLEGLRNDIRSAAQGLRKAGEASRQLLGRLDDQQLELSLNEPDRNQQLQQLVEQSQLALKEAIEGLVLASQKINMGQHEGQRLAEFMAVNQTAWSNLLEQVERSAESASQDSEAALRLAKRLIQQSANLPNNQAASAPPQLLP